MKATNSLRRAETETRSAMKIGEVSKLSGIGIEALRFYERSGLLGRPARTSSGYRLYDTGVLDRLAFIKQAQVLGFALDEIKQIIADAQAGKSPCAEVREIVRHRLEELDERMAQMRCYRKELAATLAGWEETGDAPGSICGLIEGSNIEQDLSETRGMKKRSAKKR